MWTILEGIAVAQSLEPTAIENGWHVALGGSVLIKGLAEKDLDIFFYEHTPKKSEISIHRQEPEQVIRSLNETFTYVEEELAKREVSCHDGIYKRVFRLEHLQRRIDFIFLCKT